MKLLLKSASLVLVALLVFSACGTRKTADGKDTAAVTTVQGGNDTTDSGAGQQTPSDTRSLKDIYDACIAQVDAEFPSLVETPVNSDNFSYYFGITDSGVAESTFVSEPMMGAIPFGVSMLRVKDGENAAEIAAQMKAGVDPRRWICVTASYVETAVKDDVIILVLDNDDARGAAIIEAFKNQ